MTVPLNSTMDVVWSVIRKAVSQQLGSHLHHQRREYWVLLESFNYYEAYYFSPWDKRDWKEDVFLKAL